MKCSQIDLATGTLEFFVVNRSKQRGCWLPSHTVDASTFVIHRHLRIQPLRQIRQQEMKEQEEKRRKEEEKKRKEEAIAKEAASRLATQKALKQAASLKKIDSTIKAIQKLHEIQVQQLMKECNEKGLSVVPTDVIKPWRDKHLSQMQGVLEAEKSTVYDIKQLTEKLCQAESQGTKAYVNEMQKKKKKKKKMNSSTKVKTVLPTKVFSPTSPPNQNLLLKQKLDRQKLEQQIKQRQMEQQIERAQLQQQLEHKQLLERQKLKHELERQQQLQQQLNVHGQQHLNVHGQQQLNVHGQQQLQQQLQLQQHNHQAINLAQSSLNSIQDPFNSSQFQEIPPSGFHHSGLNTYDQVSIAPSQVPQGISQQHQHQIHGAPNVYPQYGLNNSNMPYVSNAFPANERTTPAQHSVLMSHHSLDRGTNGAQNGFVLPQCTAANVRNGYAHIAPRTGKERRENTQSSSSVTLYDISLAKKDYLNQTPFG